MNLSGEEISNSSENIIFQIKPVNFWRRFLLKEFLFYLISGIILFLFYPLELNTRIICSILISILGSSFTLSRYHYFTFYISRQNNILIIEYLNWNKKQKIEFDLKNIKIELSIDGFYRSTFKIINFRKTYDYLFRIEPEFRFVKYWTDKIIEEVFIKIIEEKNKVKNNIQNI